jgi:hypothetical protein
MEPSARMIHARLSLILILISTEIHKKGEMVQLKTNFLRLSQWVVLGSITAFTINYFLGNEK